MKKKLPIIIAVIVILYAGIFTIIMLGINRSASTAYDNQKLLVQNVNSYNRMNYKRSTKNGITSIACGKMTGVDTIWQNDVSEDISLQMYYTFQVTSGKAKLVLVNPNDTIITLAELDSAVSADHGTGEPSILEDSGAETVAELNLQKGKNRIKIVCEKGTAFSLSFEIPEL